MLYIWFSIYFAIQKTISNEEVALIAYVIFFVLIVTTVFILFFMMFQKRKNQLLLDKIKQKQKFDEELIKTQQEIQEETLKHIGRELHDNIGQLLAFSSMQMNSVAKVVSEDLKTKVDNASENLKESLSAVRALSKSLNTDVINNLGFHAIVENEIKRLNKMGLIEAELKTHGDIKEFDNKKDSIILFRILQEFFSNTLKYANAENILVTLNYHETFLDINISDDGDGFEISDIEKGSGLINMEKRAELIETTFDIESKPMNGTTLKMKYNFREA